MLITLNLCVVDFFIYIITLLIVMNIQMGRSNCAAGLTLWFPPQGRAYWDLQHTYRYRKGGHGAILFFELSDTGYNLRGHSKRLTVNRCRLDSRKYCFSNRLVHHWNNLTREIILLMLGRSTSSRTVWTGIGKIWAFKEWFFSAHHRPSIKYK